MLRLVISSCMRPFSDLLLKPALGIGCYKIDYENICLCLGEFFYRSCFWDHYWFQFEECIDRLPTFPNSFPVCLYNQLPYILSCLYSWCGMTDCWFLIWFSLSLLTTSSYLLSFFEGMDWWNADLQSVLYYFFSWLNRLMDC